MRKLPTVFASLLALVAVPLLAAGTPDFSGKWSFNPAISTNVGMMSVMQMNLEIAQTPTSLAIKETTSFQGQPGGREIRYDLGGKTVVNEGAMGGKAETVARWDGERLVVVWTSEGAVAGTQVTRTETRWLSADRRTMSVQTVRGENKPVVMVFERK
ncbi:MAG: hypothetical protein U1F11_12775 [Steroidobacteraceae bacterium]